MFVINLYNFNFYIVVKSTIVYFILTFLAAEQTEDELREEIEKVLAICLYFYHSTICKNI